MTTPQPTPPLPPMTLEAWSNLLAGQILGFLFDGEPNPLTLADAERITYAIKENVRVLWSIRPPEQHV